jgi:integrase/recombinase XerD
MTKQLSLFLRFCSEDKAMVIEKVTLKTLTKNLINDFLTWLETHRGCAVSTRNQRLAAIHSFFRYLQLEEPSHLFKCQQILSISMKRTGRKVVNYLTLDAIKIILEAPDTTAGFCCRQLILKPCSGWNVGAGVTTTALSGLRKSDMKFLIAYRAPV